MPTLAEDFAYWLANPASPAFNEGTNMVEFWGLGGLLDYLNESGMLDHADIASLRTLSTIWNVHLRDKTFHGVTFTQYYKEGNEIVYAAVNF